jgi:membrane-associated phospholipid phosphatase
MSLRVKPGGWSVWPLRIAVGAILIWLAFALDNVVQRTVLSSGDNQAVHPLKTGLAAAIAHGLSKYGDWQYLLGLGGVVIAALFLFRRYRASRVLTLILIAGMLAGFSCTLIRSTVGRTRPIAQHPQGFYGPRLDSHWIVGKYEFGAFPSGHTATAMGLAAAIWMFSRRWALVMGSVGAAIAWSRIALGCHHFSDVVAATVWAFFVAPAVVLLLNPILSRLWRKFFGRWRKELADWDESIQAAPMLSAEKAG